MRPHKKHGAIGMDVFGREDGKRVASGGRGAGHVALAADERRAALPGLP